jgi:pyrroline-5-carboxylate reductase
MSTVVFLGGGRITSAMLAGLRLAKTRYRLVVHDRNPGKLRDLKKRYGVAVEPDLNSAVKKADLLIVAVRPSSVREVLRALGNAIGNMDRPLLAVSLAAGVPLRLLSKLAGPPVRWARAMPSPLCRSGRGLTAVTFPRSLPRADRKRVRDFFAGFGQVVEIPESKFDAFTVTYSCSHGYHALAALARTGRAAGLDRNTALLAGAHALADGIIAWRDGKHSLESLLEEAVTPGGIASATVKKMDAAGYGRAVCRGVTAGLRRARANAGR